MSSTNLPTQPERLETIRRAVEAALARFSDEGFNCAESVLYGVAAALNLPSNDAVLRAATPFGGASAWPALPVGR